MYLCNWTMRPSVRKSSAVAEHRAAEVEGLVALLIEEVGAVVVAVEIGGGDQDEVWLLELVAGLEGLVEDGAGEQVAHLEADEGLAAARGGRVDLGVQAGVGGVLKLEERLALDFDCIDECGHEAVVLPVLAVSARAGRRRKQDADADSAI